MPKRASSSTSVKVSPSSRRRRQTVYRVRNGAAYNAGLKQQGSLNGVADALKAWYDQGPTQRGSSYIYSDLAIQAAVACVPDGEPRDRGTPRVCVAQFALGDRQTGGLSKKEVLKPNGHGTNLTLQVFMQQSHSNKK